MKCAPFVFLLGLVVSGVNAQSDSIVTATGSIVIHPVQHASMVLKADNLTIYVDPTGGAAPFGNFDKPDFILLTDIHGDHTDPETIDAVKDENTFIVAPKAVAEKLTNFDTTKIRVLNNGNELEYHGITILAVPMYNLPETADSRHPKGRGNGYVLTIAGKKLYVSGDTEDIPEMRRLKNIDVAFVCMNLPYTMDVKQAASAVLAFKPAIVYPYHYRGQGGLADVKQFQQLVNQGNKKIEVRLRNWYASN